MKIVRDFRRWGLSGAALVGVFSIAIGIVNSGSLAQSTSQQSASKVVRDRQDDGAKAEPRRNKGIQNRINPKQRAGKEGSAEAKIDADQARELYIRRKLRLEQIRAQQRELSRDKWTLATNRARMRARLIETARAIRLSEKRLTEIEEKVAPMRIKVKEQREKLEDKTSQMFAVLAVMQGMSREPPPLLITHTRDALKMVRSGMVLATFYGDIEKLATQLSAEVAALETTQKEAELQEQRRKAEQLQNSRLKDQIDVLLQENRNQLEANAATLATLKSATAINVAGLKSLEEMLRVLDAEAAKRPNAASGAADSKKDLDVSPNGMKTAVLQPGALKPSIPFANAHGLLPWPVQGKILTRFGQSDESGTVSKGVHLEVALVGQAEFQAETLGGGWHELEEPCRTVGAECPWVEGGFYLSQPHQFGGNLLGRKKWLEARHIRFSRRRPGPIGQLLEPDFTLDLSRGIGPGLGRFAGFDFGRRNGQEELIGHVQVIHLRSEPQGVGQSFLGTFQQRQDGFGGCP